MAKQKKATKQFVKNHLSDEIHRRRKFKQIQHQRGGKSSSAGRPAKIEEAAGGSDSDDDRAAPAGRGAGAGAGARRSGAAAPRGGASRIEDMNLDEFLAGGFGRVPLGEEDAAEDGAAGAGTEEEEEEDSDELGAAYEEADGTGADDDEDGDIEAVDIDADEEEDEDDDDEDKAAGVGGGARKLQSAVSKHQADLAALKARDPDFYAYLAENDAELLQFEDGEEEEEEEEEGEEGDKKKKKAKKAKGGEEGEAEEASEGGAGAAVLTAEAVTRWAAAARGGAAGATRNLLRAFRAACHYGELPSEDGDEAAAAQALAISSAGVFNHVMLTALREMDAILRARLGQPLAKQAEGGGAGAPPPMRIDPSSARWRRNEALVKSYLGNALHVLAQMTDAPLLRFTLRRLGASIGLLAPLPALQRRVLAQAVSLLSHDDAALRLQAALFVREAAIALPPPALDSCLKGAYRAFASAAKFAHPSARPAAAFLATLVVELYGLAPEASYARAFVYIRQAALHLRDALAARGADALQRVYSWQFVQCLELWAAVLAAHAADPKSVLRPLVYPLAQIILGTARLVPTARFFPLRLRCARALHRLSASTGVYVPLSSLLLEVLTFAGLARAPSSEAGGGGGGPGGGGGGPLDLDAVLRVPKAGVRGAGFQQACVDAALEVLTCHLAQWATSASFPELSHLPAVALRRFAKDSPVERFRRTAKALLEALERNAAWVGRRRDTAGFSPRDATACEAFAAAGKQSGGSPLARYAAQVEARAVAARAALRATHITVGEGSGRGHGGRGSSDSEGEYEESDEEAGGRDGAAAAFARNRWLPSGTKRPLAAVEDGFAPEAEDDDDRDAARGRAAKAARRAAEAEAADWGEEGGAGEEDQVMPYVDDDEEDEDDEEGSGGGRGKKPAGRGRGGGRGGGGFRGGRGAGGRGGGGFRGGRGAGGRGGRRGRGRGGGRGRGRH